MIMKARLIFLLFLIGITYGAELNCTFGSETPWPQCLSFTLTPVTSANEEINILGQPSNYVDIYTQSLQFNELSVLNFIPTNLFKHFSNFQYFYAYNSSITTLVTDSFNFCGNLTQIGLTYNSISHVPARIASSCHFIERLDLSNNKIQTIDETALEGMKNLRFIYLTNNEITCIPPLLFQNTFGLNSIDFSYNRITALHPATFKRLTLLNQIQLGFNQIGYIPNFDLKQTSLLAHNYFFINLHGNLIMAIDPQFMKKLFYNRQNNVGSSLNIDFMPESIYNVTCDDPMKDPSKSMLHSIESYNWVQQDSMMAHRTSCYSNWNEEMASNNLVTCGSQV